MGMLRWIVENSWAYARMKSGGMRKVVRFTSISARGPCALGVDMGNGYYDTDFRNVQSVYFAAPVHSPQDRFDWLLRAGDLLSSGASLFFCIDGNVMEYTRISNEALTEEEKSIRAITPIQSCFICGMIPVCVALNGAMDLP